MKAKNWLIVTAVVIAVTLGAVLLAYWPFTEARAMGTLERLTGSHVKPASYTMRFVPWPGFVANDVVIIREGTEPLARIRKLTLQTSWLYLLTLQHRATTMRIEGMQVKIPVEIPPPLRFKQGPARTEVDRIEADGTALDVARENAPPVHMAFGKLVLENVSKSSQIRYTTAFKLSELEGDMNVDGVFGPWQGDKPEATAVSGRFQIKNADLAQYKGLSGVMASEGQYSGALSAIAIRGNTDTTGFAVNGSEHRVALHTDAELAVSALTGDVTLRKIDAQFRHSRLKASGSITLNPQTKRRATRIEFDSEDSRVEDLLWLFVKSSNPALSGPIALHANTSYERHNERFLRELSLDGRFRINRGWLTRPQTRDKVADLSARARGNPDEAEDHDSPDVQPTISGTVRMREGIASLSDIVFSVPGATARGGGPYNLISKKVDLRGTVAMEVKLSHATKGFKSLLLKPFDLFLKKNARGGSNVPIHVSGYWPHPQFGMSLTGR